jgi:hypothetical protein
MSNLDAKRSFLRAVLPRFFLSNALPKDYFDHLLPPEMLKRLPENITFEKVDPLLLDEPLCEACFKSVQSLIQRDWDKLASDTASVIHRAIADYSLQIHFASASIKLSDARREYLKVRFDLADVFYRDLSQSIYDELKALNVDRNAKVVFEDLKYNESSVIAKFAELVELRRDVDLAMVTIANVQRSREIVRNIQARTQTVYFDYLDELRELLRNSTTWVTPNGEYFLADDKEMADKYITDIRIHIEKRLSAFKERGHEAIDATQVAVTPWNVLNGCKQRIKGLAMSEQQPQAISIDFAGSTIGVVNTGQIQTINGINQSIGALQTKGEGSVAEALKEITKRVVGENSGLSETERTEVLDQIQTLSKLAAAPNRNENPGVVKAIVRSLAISLAASSLKDVWVAHAPRAVQRS